MSRKAKPSNYSDDEDDYYSKIPASAKKKKIISPRSSTSGSSYDDDDDDDDEYDKLAPKIYENKHVPHRDYTIRVSAIFNEGYYCRKIFEFLDKNLTAAPIFFTKDGIVIERANDLGSIAIQTFVDKDQLLEYNVKINEDEEEYNPPFINLKLRDFLVNIKNARKNTKICICQYEELPNIVFLGFSGGSKQNSFQIFKTEDFDFKKYSFGEEEHIKPDANVIISLVEFCDSCVHKGISKSEFSTFKTTPKGLKIKSPTSSGTNKCIGEWGDSSESRANRNNKRYVKVKNTILSGISFLKNLNPGGVLLVYCNKQGMLRLESKVFSIGQIYIHLLDPEIVDINNME